MSTHDICFYGELEKIIMWILLAGGGGRGGGGGGGNFGTGVRASISKPTPIIYLAFEKTDPFIY